MNSATFIHSNWVYFCLFSSLAFLPRILPPEGCNLVKFRVFVFRSSVSLLSSSLRLFLFIPRFSPPISTGRRERVRKRTSPLYLRPCLRRSQIECPMDGRRGFGVSMDRGQGQGVGSVVRLRLITGGPRGTPPLCTHHKTQLNYKQTASDGGRRCSAKDRRSRLRRSSEGSGGDAAVAAANGCPSTIAGLSRDNWINLGRAIDLHSFCVDDRDCFLW